MSYKILTESPDEIWTGKWNAFLENAAFPTHYATPNYFIDPFVRGAERFAILALKNDEITGVLTGTADGGQIVSGFSVRPQICIGKHADRLETAESIVKGLLEKGGNDLKVVSFFSWEPIPEFEKLGFRSRRYDGERGTIVLDLTRGADRLFKEFSQTRRSELRKTIKENKVLISEVENTDELAELYLIHRDWNRRKGNQPDEFADFQLAWEQKDYRKIFVAKTDGKIIAGSYYRFCPGGVVEYAANNSLTEYQRLRPNDLLGWHSIQWACRNRFTHYSMGGSHLFLRRFGGANFTTYRYKSDRTFLRIHDIKESVADFGACAYKSLPVSVKAKIKAVLGGNQ